MLVDLNKGTLSVFLNNVHLGFMVKAVRLISHHFLSFLDFPTCFLAESRVAQGITGPLCWMAELNTPGDAVRIRRQNPVAYMSRQGPISPVRTRNKKG